jgi:plasmid stability protein
MTNMTITVDEDVLRWAKVWAAQHGTSVSRLVGDMLRARMAREDAYERAMAAYLAAQPRRLSESGQYPRREALYDRPQG